MCIESFIKKGKEMQNDLLDFIDDQIEYLTFTQKLIQYQLQKNHYEFKTFLYLIVNISNNHYRYPSFFQRL